MFRDRTNLYISYRRTFPHHSFATKAKTKNKSKKTRFDLLPEEEQGLITQQERDEFEEFEITDSEDDGFEDVAVDASTENIEMTTLPPVFLDIADEIDSLLTEVKTKTESLAKLYKKNILPGFSDRTADEEEIEKMNYVITSKFQTCFSLVKKLEMIRKKKTLENSFTNKSEAIMLENVKKNYALKIQQASSDFRKLQNNYIKFLKEDDFEPIGNQQEALGTQLESFDPVAEELETAEAEQYSRDAIKQTQTHLLQSSQLDAIVRQRETEINKIAKGVLEVSAIFKEMQNMVIEQGTILDRIDYNLENAKHDLQQTNKELVTATNYQKKTNKCKMILFLVLVVAMLLMILIVKPKKHSNGGSAPDTKAPEKQPNTQGPEKGAPKDKGQSFGQDQDSYNELEIGPLT